MRFLIDNALSPAVAAALRDAGHDASHVRDHAMQSAGDEEIFAFAGREELVVVSADTDFGTLLAARRAHEPSVILFRGGTQRRPEQQVRLLLENLPRVQPDLDAGSVVVFEQGRIRIRRLPLIP